VRRFQEAPSIRRPPPSFCASPYLRSSAAGAENLGRRSTPINADQDKNRQQKHGPGVSSKLGFRKPPRSPGFSFLLCQVLSAFICVNLRQGPKTWAADQRRLTQIKTKTEIKSSDYEVSGALVPRGPHHLPPSPFLLCQSLSAFICVNLRLDFAGRESSCVHYQKPTV
jgi:hypothetical protein